MNMFRFCFRHARLAAAMVSIGCGLAGFTPHAAHAQGEPLVIGMTAATMINPFYVAETEGVKRAAKQVGAKALIQFAEFSVENQSNQIDAFVRQKVSFIIVDAVDSDAIGPAVKRAKAAGIPVVAVDVAASGANATVTSDNVLAGFQSCQRLAKGMTGGRGNIVLLDGLPVSAVQDRMQGCRSALKAFPDVKVVAEQRTELSRESGLAVATDVLTAHPGVDGIFAANDPSAAGAELALKQKGNHHTIVTGVDGAKQAIDRIASSDGQIVATAAQDPDALGKRAVELGMELRRGANVSPTVEKVPTKLIDRGNVASYKPWG
ncbi:substrate-binding domain-containing protein [Paraburkholderia terrae]|uniref:substrate-binding domain-containing protein n=1 Tax=Paraburkholderia terrae TaxID=311230 RepID=UPI0020663A80|nr:substrate-binding domain-containing protein [Paraburkholderia terrae]BDC45947.1 ribose ABC transporter substrate-binding protein [Paraburkholderia terrae]